MIDSLKHTFLRDLRIHMRCKHEFIRPIILFLMIGGFIPMFLRLGSNELSHLAPGIIWIASVMTLIICSDPILPEDFEDGSLEQLLLSPNSLAMILMGKIFANWLVIILPILIFAPLLGLVLNLPLEGFLGLICTLALGLPALSLVILLCVAITLGLRQRGILLTFLTLPLIVPILIFGVSGSVASSQQLPYLAEVCLLAAFLLILICLVPFLLGIILRVRCG